MEQIGFCQNSWRNKLHSVFVCSGDTQDISSQAWFSLWKRSFGKRRKLQYPYISWIIGLSVKKGTGIVSKSVTVCKNEHSPVENTFTQSVRVSFGQNWRTTQVHLPCSTAGAWWQQQLWRPSQNTGKQSLNTNLQLKLVWSFSTQPQMKYT